MKRKLLLITCAFTCLISVSALRAQVTVTPASTTICAGEIQQLTASGGGSGTSTLFSENFEGTGLGNFTGVAVTGTLTDSQWTNQTSPHTVTSGSWEAVISSGSKFALSNSDFNEGTVNFAMQSGVLNTTGYTSLTLTFRHFYSDYSATNDSAYVEVSINGGTSWTTIQTYNSDLGSQASFATATVNFGDYLNQTNFKFRLRYQAAWNDGWAVDDVVVSGMSASAASFTWSPTAGLYTDASATTAYTGTVASTVYAKPAATATYTASYTSGGDTFTGSATVTVTNPAAPTADAAQEFCNTATVDDLDAEGNVVWYSVASNGFPLSNTTALTNGTTYYAAQIADGCEGTARTAVAVTITTTAVPTVTDASQTVCSGSTIADLEADGQGLKWYAANTGGTALSGDTVLVNGNSYYASQTIEGCESAARAAVAVTINIVPAPGVPAAEQTFCNAATVAGLAADGEGLKWYADDIGGTSLADDTSLVSGNTYYASQTVDGCESTARAAVSVMIHVTDAPTILDATQSFCNMATVADLEADGGDIKWYAANTGGTALAEDTALTDGSVYYASQTIDDCESAARTAVTAEINVVNEPGGDTTQEINAGTAEEATIEDIVVTATGTVAWYASEEDALNGDDPLPVTTQLVSGNTYYAVQTIEDCSSTTALAVMVDVILGNEGFTKNSLMYYPNPVTDLLTVSHPSGINSVKVFNMLGQQVLSQEPNTSEAKINMSGIAPGTYIMNVTIGDSIKAMKIVKR